MKLICVRCKKEFEFEIRGHINPFSPILDYCPECIARGKNKLSLLSRIRFKLMFACWNINEYLYSLFHEKKKTLQIKLESCVEEIKFDDDHCKIGIKFKSHEEVFNDHSFSCKQEFKWYEIPTKEEYLKLKKDLINKRSDKK